jgi:hypothetical protein
MKKTNWDSYYSNPYKTSTFSRKITSNKLIRLLKQFLHEPGSNLRIAELGGANSCFYESINKEFSIKEYTIVDNNKVGLDKTVERLSNSTNIVIRNEDILGSTEKSEKFDVVFSVGLIEHFSVEATQRCIASHFNYLKYNGICIITFPTPTWLYKITRKCAELLGIWIFHDERPLKSEEVKTEMKRHGIIKHESITWPIFLTQGVIVAVKS